MAQESLSGVRVVRAYRQEAAEIERFRAPNESTSPAIAALIRLQGVVLPEHDASSSASARCSCSGWAAATSSRAASRVGEFVAFNAYLAMLSWPMIAFGWVTNLLQRGMASWKRMLEVLDEPPAIAGCGRRQPARESPDRRGDIEFRHLTFAYRRRRRCSTTSTLSIEAGPDRGDRRPDRQRQVDAAQPAAAAARPAAGHGLPRRRRRARSAAGDAARRDRHRAAGAVPVLRDGGGNITFGCTAARARWTAARRRPRRSRASTKTSTPSRSGCDTMVGERGITLSGGQKQRTAIARALIDRPADSVLDDALSAVDTYTEEEILRACAASCAQRTSIIVVHRMSTVRDADLILVLDDGRIAERGRTTSWSRAAGPTASCIASSCWKRSWRHLSVMAHEEEFSARPTTPLDEAAVHLCLAVSAPAAAAMSAIICSSVLQLAQPYLIKLASINTSPARDLSGWAGSPSFLADAAGEFVLEYLQTWRCRSWGSGSCSTCGRSYEHLQRLASVLRSQPGRRLMTASPATSMC